MNWYKVFYWFSVIDNISTFAYTLAGCLTAIVVISFVVKVFVDDYEELILTRAKSIFKWSLPFACIFWVAALLIPTKKQMLLIIAGGSVGNFIQGDSSVQKLPSDVTRYLHLSMKKEIENLSTETKEELGIATPKETAVSKMKEMTKEQIIDYLKNDTTLLK